MLKIPPVTLPGLKPGASRVAQERINQVSAEPTEPAEVKTRRIPFKRLIAEGLIAPGQTLLFRRDPALVAIIQPDGKLRYRDLHGSIHKLAHLLAEAPCNGWQHWYFTDERGDLLQIDTLRQKLRKP
jgi:hypothetical protein